MSLRDICFCCRGIVPTIRSIQAEAFRQTLDPGRAEVAARYRPRGRPGPLNRDSFRGRGGREGGRATRFVPGGVFEAYAVPESRHAEALEPGF